jgi:hypothetical protein
VLLVTARVTVQVAGEPVAPAGMVIPLKVRVPLAPAEKELELAPVHVPPTVPLTALRFVSVSWNEAPWRATVLVLPKVKVRVEPVVEPD